MYISLKERQQVIDKLTGIQSYDNGIANLLNDALNKLSTFRTRNWVEINDDMRGAYFPNKQIRFKTAILRSSYT